MIKAECHSDDRFVEVSFDATKWFKQATGKKILALAVCGWSGDYPADNVAEYMADFNESIAEMYTYIGIRNKSHIDCGFECSVDPEEALAWLKKNKPRIAKRVCGMVTA